MRKKNFKGRCQKRKVEKCKDVCRTYDPIQFAFADVLSKREDIKEFRCNVVLENSEWDEYMSDFVCIRTDGAMIVYECVNQKLVERIATMKLLDESRKFWISKGAEWGIVINEETNEK